MSSNPYASPESDVSTHANAEIQNTSIWNKKGRLSVLSYWGQTLLLAIVGMLLIAIVGVVALMLTGGLSGGLESFNPEDINPLALIPVAIVYFTIIWVSTCQAIKRFHDLNLNGWWVLTTLIGVGVIALLIPSKGQPNRFGGWRSTKTWEKVLGVIFLLFFVTALVSPIIGLVMSGVLNS